MDCRKLRLKDSIHFTAGSVSEVSTMIIDHINNKYLSEHIECALIDNNITPEVSREMVPLIIHNNGQENIK